MESKWKTVKKVLGLRFCLNPMVREEESEEERSKQRDARRKKMMFSFSSPLSTYGLSDGAAGNASSGSFTCRLSPASSKAICAICLASLKPGKGHAIFTAECTHTFHFHCIATSMKLGSKMCPICRARWKEIPFRTSTSHASGDRDDRCRYGGGMNIVRPLPNTHNQRPDPDDAPPVFSDDEELEQPLHAARRKSKRSSPRNIEVKLFPEFPAVLRSSSHDDFAVLINMKAPLCSTKEFNEMGRASIDLVTVLDISGSMAGTKLTLLKRAMCFVIQNLGSSDRLSLVVFCSTARRVFPLRRMTQTGKEDALRAVNSLTCTGGTNIADGLMKGAKVITDRRWKNQVTSIILLSDGHDTYKINSSSVTRSKTGGYSSLVPESLHKNGISGYHIPVHSFGFGADHDTEAMHIISEISGGTFSFIEAEHTIQNAFALCIGGLLSVVMQELRIKVKCAHPVLQISSFKAGCYQTSVSEKVGTVVVGDLYAEEERDFLLTVHIPAVQFCGRMPLLKVECSYKDPVTKQMIYLEAGGETFIERPDFIGGQEVSTEVDRQRNRLLAAEAMAIARQKAEKGNMHRARMILESCLRSLLQSAAFRAGDKLCVSLCNDLKEMIIRMSSREVYEASGRAYVLSGMASHSSQRATTRGDLLESTSAAKHYQTSSMADMISRSHTFLLDNPPRGKLRQTLSFPAL